jgi:hypothetical protein
MGRWSLWAKGCLAGLLALVAAAAVVAWLERGPLETWYTLRRLIQANEADREAWAEQTAALDEAVVPGLSDALTRKEDGRCANVEAALLHLAARWGMADGRTAQLSGSLADAFPRCSGAGQRVVLRVQAAWLGKYPEGEVPPPGMLLAAARSVALAARGNDSGVRHEALQVTVEMFKRANGEEKLGGCRELLQACLQDPEAANRSQAIVLAQHPAMGLLEQITPLLGDPVPEVRREAMAAARSAPETVVQTDHLLRWLHDPDDDVRRLCEAVLRGRGMTEEHLKLGRLLTDARASVRLQVLDYLHPNSGLEPGVWLRLLSVDAEPAVRVAAVRAAVAHPQVDLSDRIDQMAQSDPSPTVCQLARYYLASQVQRKQSPR